MAPRRSAGAVAPVGVAMIARDAEATLGRCLDSIRPYVEQIVVGVDTLTKDRTAKVARQHGATTFPVAVSHPHVCEQHGEVMAQHFANARNESFTHLDPALPWHMWLDADDTVQNADQLATLLPSLDPRYVGVWLPYQYASVQGRSNTEFHRERICRTVVDRDGVPTPQGWRWHHRVHEVVKPEPDGPWFGTEAIKVIHQEGVHKSESSATRNLLLLEIDLEEDPKDARAIFYVGNQYFAMAKWREAAEWYERLLALRHDNLYERWQSAIYLSMAYERLGDLGQATQAAFCAIDDVPWHAEPYFRLASLNLAAGRFDQVEFWTDIGRTKGKQPPFFVFKNPLDYTFNNRVCLADALANMGKIEDAEKELKEAYAVLPDPQIERALAGYAKLRSDTDAANAFIGAVRSGFPEDAVQRVYDTLSPEVRQFPQVRQAVVPALLKGRVGSQPRIVFWCGRAYEEWAPPKLNETGIGGSETAVVEVAKRFAADGWTVDVFNGAGRHEGVYDGVGYWDPERYDSAPLCDMLVSWRQPAFHGQMQSMHDILWCHDLNYGPQPEYVWPRFEAVVGVSAWHARMLRDYYGLPEEQVGFVPNGITLERFKDAEVARVPMRCVYASSADRGLLRLLALWPRVRQAEPEAELHVAYGWDTIDRMIATGRQDLAQFKAHVEQTVERTEGVTWLGRLPQDQLANLYQSATAWAYPTDFLEVSCISAMEAMAGGAVPVTSRCGALPETIADGGVLVPHPHSRTYGDTYLTALLGVLTSPRDREKLKRRGFERALHLTWDSAYTDHWKPLVERLLGGDHHDRPNASAVLVAEGAAV